MTNTGRGAMRRTDLAAVSLFVLMLAVVVATPLYTGELREAAEKGDTGTARTLLAQGADVNITARNQISQEAAQALDRGLRAAKQQDWALAVRYFEEARKTAPTAPQILFNLGLAESKMAGRELRAIAWLRAYQLADPRAENARQVQDLTADLEIKVESSMGKLVALAKQSAEQMRGDDRLKAFEEVAEAQARSGDLAGAKQTALKADRCENERSCHGYRSAALFKIAVIQFHAGDRAAAMDTVNQMKVNKEFFSDVAYIHIAHLQAITGDYAGANSTANLVRREDFRKDTLKCIAAEQAFRESQDKEKRLDVKASLGRDSLANTTGDCWLKSPPPTLPDERILVLTRIVSDDLNGELFTDFGSALRAIAARPTSKAMFSEVVQAIKQMGDRLHDFRVLGR
jgi:hypothetical protein